MGTLNGDVQNMRLLIEDVRQEHEDLLPDVARDYAFTVSRFLRTYEKALTERPNREGGSVSLHSEWIRCDYVAQLGEILTELERIRDFCEHHAPDSELLSIISAAIATINATIDAIGEWMDDLSLCTKYNRDTVIALRKFMDDPDYENDYEIALGIAEDDIWFRFEKHRDDFLDAIVSCVDKAKSALNKLRYITYEMDEVVTYTIERMDLGDVDALLNDCVNTANGQAAALKDTPNARFSSFWADRIGALIEFVRTMLLPKLPNVLKFILDNHKAAPKEMLDGLPTSDDFAEALGATLVGEE